MRKRPIDDDPVKAVSRALSDHLRVLIIMGEIESIQEFAKDAGVTFPNIKSEKGFGEKISRWKNHDDEGNWQALDDDNLKRLLDHTVAEFPFLKYHLETPLSWKMRAPLYHSIASTFKIGGRKLAFDYVMEQLLGIYEIYRPSNKVGDFVYIGALELRFDNVSQAFVTRELYKNKLGAAWDIHGVFIPVTKAKFMMFGVNTNDDIVDTKYINSVSSNKDVVISFDGWVADMSGNRYYSAPIYFEKRKDVKDINDITLDFVDITEPKPNLSEHVLIILNKMLDQEEHPLVWRDKP